MQTTHKVVVVVLYGMCYLLIFVCLNNNNFTTSTLSLFGEKKKGFVVPNKNWTLVKQVDDYFCVTFDNFLCE